jgi:hypothetical protein
MGKNLTFTERAEWVDQWRRSRRSAREFCEGGKERPSVSSLYRWARELADVGGAPAVEARLVEVVPVAGRAVDENCEWQWELEGASGVLRGRALDPACLAELVAAVTRRTR